MMGADDGASGSLGVEQNSGGSDTLLTYSPLGPGSKKPVPGEPEAH